MVGNEIMWLLAITLASTVADDRDEHVEKVEEVKNTCSHVAESDWAKLSPLLGYMPTFVCNDCRYVCHDEDGADNLLISLYSGHYKMSLFSAAMISQKPKLQRPKNFRKGGNPVSIEDYSVFTSFVKGHLFPHRYATSKAQSYASFDLSNIVPQDSVFNSGAWSWAESKIEAWIGDCVGLPGHKAIVVVGAVPEYFGKYKDHDKPNEESKVFRVGKTNLNSVSDQPFSRYFIEDSQSGVKIFGVDRGLNVDKPTAPTHMWTQFVCHNTIN